MGVDEAFVLLFFGEVAIILAGCALFNDIGAGFLAHIIIVIPGMIVGYIAEEFFVGDRFFPPNMWPFLICTWLPGILLNIALVKKKIRDRKETRESEKLAIVKNESLLRLFQKRKEIETHLQTVEVCTTSARITAELLNLMAICTENDPLFVNGFATTTHFRKLAVNTIAEYADRKQLADIDRQLEKWESCKDIEAIESVLNNQGW